jgi:hypothetical protein
MRAGGSCCCEPLAMASGGSAGETKAGPPHLARAVFGAILGMGPPWPLSAKAAADADMLWCR